MLIPCSDGPQHRSVCLSAGLSAYLSSNAVQLHVHSNRADVVLKNASISHILCTCIVCVYGSGSEALDSEATE